MLKQEQNYEKPYLGMAYKIEFFYTDGQLSKVIAYDKDGNVLPVPGVM